VPRLVVLRADASDERGDGTLGVPTAAAVVAKSIWEERGAAGAAGEEAAMEVFGAEAGDGEGAGVGGRTEERAGLREVEARCMRSR